MNLETLGDFRRFTSHYPDSTPIGLSDWLGDRVPIEDLDVYMTGEAKDRFLTIKRLPEPEEKGE